MCHPVTENLFQSRAIQRLIGMLGRDGGGTGRIAEDGTRHGVRASKSAQDVSGIERITSATCVDHPHFEGWNSSGSAVAVDSAPSGTKRCHNMLDTELLNGLRRPTQLSNPEGHPKLRGARQGDIDQGKHFTDRLGHAHGGVPREIDRSPYSRLPRRSKSLANGLS